MSTIQELIIEINTENDSIDDEKEYRIEVLPPYLIQTEEIIVG